MDREALIQKVNTHAKDGVIACKQALKIALEEGISSKDLGVLLNELKIKIASCQLGCFP